MRFLLRTQRDESRKLFLSQQLDIARSVCQARTGRLKMSSVLDEVLEGLEPSPEIVSVMASSRPVAVLALDIGTSGVRASLFDDRGNEINGASISIQQRRSIVDGIGITDAETCFDLITEAIDALFESSYQPVTRIDMIAVSCFWHSLLGIDAQGSVTTPLYTWADTQSASAIKELQSRFNETEIHARTGCRFHPSYWPAKLLLLRKEEPKTFSQTRRWLSFADYLVLRFFGDTATSVSMASGTGLFDQKLIEWDKELIHELEIDRNSLPEIASEERVFQGLASEFATRWPQLTEARLFLPIGDGAANSIGSGCTNRDHIALMIGTSGAMRVLYEGEPPAQLPRELWCYRADRKRVMIGGALSDGGSLYRWIIESLLAGYNSESIEAALEAVEPDSHGLTVLPFWAGERSTGWSSEAKGAILGLTLTTEPVEILRAAMESVAYRFALIAKALAPFAPNAGIIASGKALCSSHVWVQIISDVLGRSATLSESSEASTRGAALLALEAAGKISSIEVSRVRDEETFQPNMSHHARYQQGLERQLKLYDKVITQS